MDRGSKEAGVKRIRIHDLRHSHVSLLIEMGFSALAIANRVGHESIEITYRYAHLFPARGQEIADKLRNEREEVFSRVKTKNKDMQGRYRSKVIAFRVSPQEDEVLNAKVKLSGLTKQDYLIACSTDKEITVIPNPYLFKNLRNHLQLFTNRLLEISSLEELTLDELIVMETLIKTVHELIENKKAKIKATKEPRQ